MVGSDFGVTVGYHNHAWELSSHIDGRPALELFADLLDPVVLLEIDTYWAATAGQDVPALLRRLGARVFALHLKDGPLNGDIAAQLPLGRGDLPAPEIIAAAPEVQVPRSSSSTRTPATSSRASQRATHTRERVGCATMTPRVRRIPPWSQCRAARPGASVGLLSCGVRGCGPGQSEYTARGLALQQRTLRGLLDFSLTPCPRQTRLSSRTARCVVPSAFLGAEGAEEWHVATPACHCGTVADQCPGCVQRSVGCVDRSDPPVFRAYQARGTVRLAPDVRLSIDAHSRAGGSLIQPNALTALVNDSLTMRRSVTGHRSTGTFLGAAAE